MRKRANQRSWNGMIQISRSKVPVFVSYSHLSTLSSSSPILSAEIKAIKLKESCHQFEVKSGAASSVVV